MHSDNKRTLAEVDISGIEEAKLKFKDEKIKSLKVKATLELSESGLVSVPKAYVVFEIAKEPKGIIDGVMDFFKSSDKVVELLLLNDRKKRMKKTNLIRRLRVNLKSSKGKRVPMMKKNPKRQLWSRSI